MSAITDKAAQLIRSGRIVEVPAPRVFLIPSLTRNATYAVTVTGTQASCPCPAGERGQDCSHAAAGIALVNLPRESAAAQRDAMGGAA